MTIKAKTSEGGGRVEVETTEDGLVLLSWISSDGESFRWWKLDAERADHLGLLLQKHAREAAGATHQS